LQDAPDTWSYPHDRRGAVKVSFFGGLRLKRVSDPLQTADDTLLVCIAGRSHGHQVKGHAGSSEAKDYRDIAAMISAGVSLPTAWPRFGRCTTRSGPGSQSNWVLWRRDLKNVSAAERKILCDARDQIGVLPEVYLRAG